VKKIEKLYYITYDSSLTMAKSTELLGPGLWALERPYVGWKWLDDPKTKGTLLARVCIPKNALVVRPYDRKHELRTNAYFISEIHDFCMKPVTSGISPIYRRLYNVNEWYSEPNLNTNCEHRTGKGLHFYSDKRCVADLMLDTACRSGHLPAVKFWTLEGAWSFQKCLNIACEIGNIEVAKEMIARGATNFDDGLAKACGSGHRHLIDEMIACGASNWNFGLYAACQYGRVEIVNDMIRRGADDLDWGLTVAHNNGKQDIVDMLTAMGARRIPRDIW
jgi:hypothetical protein